MLEKYFVKQNSCYCCHVLYVLLQERTNNVPIDPIFLSSTKGLLLIKSVSRVSLIKQNPLLGALQEYCRLGYIIQYIHWSKTVQSEGMKYWCIQGSSCTVAHRNAVFCYEKCSNGNYKFFSPPTSFNAVVKKQVC